MGVDEGPKLRPISPLVALPDPLQLDGVLSPNVPLSEQFRHPHQYALFFHDFIVELLVMTDRADVFAAKLPSGAVGIRSDGSVGEEFFEWLAAAHPKLRDELAYKLIIRAVTSDLCDFVLESLHASSLGKLTVAFALLRKPLRDDLFTLEWLLADPSVYLTRFHDRPPHEIEVGSVEKTNFGFRSQIVEKAAGLARAPGVNPGRAHSSRFDRSSETGLASSWDKALHLTTTAKAIRTEQTNLNFVFSGAPERESQWANFYHHLPYLLYYTTFVLEALVRRIAVINEEYDKRSWIRRAICYELWAEWSRGESEDDQYNESLRSLLAALPSRCSGCEAPANYNRSALRNVVREGRSRCANCGEPTGV